MPMDADVRFREVTLPGAPLNLDFSNNGELLACANLVEKAGGSAIHLLRTSDGSVARTYQQRGSDRGRGVAFVGSGREVVFLFQNSDNATSLHRAAIDSDASKELQSYPPSARNHAVVRDLSARWFAVLGNKAEIWDAKASKVVHTLPGANRDYDVHAAFSRDGKHVYVYGTVARAVIRYEVMTAKETGRWSAPTDSGAQVVVSADERFLVIAGTSHKGLFIHDLKTGQQVKQDKDEIYNFDKDALWKSLAIAYDSSLLMSLRGALACFRLPEVEDITTRKTLVDTKLHCDAAAAAWEAPIVAFGTREDARVRLFQLTKAT